MTKVDALELKIEKMRRTQIRDTQGKTITIGEIASKEA